MLFFVTAAFLILYSPLPVMADIFISDNILPLIHEKDRFDNDGTCPLINFNVTSNTGDLFSRLKYDYSKTSKDITLLAGGNPARERKFAFFDHKVKIYFDFNAEEIPEGNDIGCFSNIDIQINVDYAPDVYIATDFEKDSEEYKYISWNINEHVNIALKNTDFYVESLKKRIKSESKKFTVLRPLTRREIEDARVAVYERINSLIVGSNIETNGKINTYIKKFDDKQRDNNKWIMSSYNNPARRYRPLIKENK